MVSLPVSEVTSVQLGSGIYPYTFSWDPQAGSYMVMNLANPEDLNAGAGTDRGLWVYATQPATLGVTGRANSGSGSDVYTDLQVGWNLLGVPYSTPLPLADSQVRVPGGRILFLTGAVSNEVTPATAESLLYGYGFVYASTAYQSVGLNNPTTSLPVGQAFWVVSFRQACLAWSGPPGSLVRGRGGPSNVGLG